MSSQTGDNADIGDLGTGTCGGRNGNERKKLIFNAHNTSGIDIIVFNLTAVSINNVGSFCAVHRTSSAYADKNIGLKCLHLFNAIHNHCISGVWSDTVEHHNRDTHSFHIFNCLSNQRKG